jgi:acylphosphatase
LVRIAKRFVVHGKVQGVGYRIFAQTCASALELTGWVRNLPDGTVEAMAEGTPDQLKEFSFDLSRGARYARVIRIEEFEAPLEGHTSFSVLNER